MYIHSYKSGFTLVEMLVVLALIVIVGNFALLVSFDTYRASSYESDRGSLISLLHHARAQAVDDVCAGSGCMHGAAHGVSIQADKYVLFQGSTYASRDVDEDSVVDTNPSVVHGGLSEVVFEPSSGNPLVTGDVVLMTANGHQSTITIGREGQIGWTN